MSLAGQDLPVRQQHRHGRTTPANGRSPDRSGREILWQEQTDQISPFAKHWCGTVKVYAEHVEARLHSCGDIHARAHCLVLLALSALAPSLIVAPTGAVADDRDAGPRSPRAVTLRWSAMAAHRPAAAAIRPGPRSTTARPAQHGRARACAGAGAREAFRRHGVPVDSIESSPWCRCLETARLMALGPVESVMAVASSERSPERLVVLNRWWPTRAARHACAGDPRADRTRARRDHAGAGRGRGGQAQAW